MNLCLSQLSRCVYLCGGVLVCMCVRVWFELVACVSSFVSVFVLCSHAGVFTCVYMCECVWHVGCVRL